MGAGGGAGPQFIATELGGAVVLLAAAVLALVWANVLVLPDYERFWSTELSIELGDVAFHHTLREWINDGLMTFFFFVIGLEIRRELDLGDLRDRRRIAVPVLAGVGGMAVPALLYLAFNAGTPAAHGWSVPMATRHGVRPRRARPDWQTGGRPVPK